MGRRPIYESRGISVAYTGGQKLEVLWELQKMNFTYNNFSWFQTILMLFLGFWPQATLVLSRP